MIREGDPRNVPFEVSFIITFIINSVSCPFTVLFNVLVIMAVKRRPRLQSNSNILLACLAATDALTGLAVQPSFILYKTFQLLDISYMEAFRRIHNSILCTAVISSALHLMLVTFERLIAIKFTVHYPYVITIRNIKVAVIMFWIVAFVLGLLRLIEKKLVVVHIMVGLIVISCVIFIASSYAILYHETRRHQNKIKTQQLPQEEVERFAKESKALKTTVFVVGAVMFCLLPAGIFLVFQVSGLYAKLPGSMVVFILWVSTFAMLNALLNPLIYCWRQKEMRKFVLRVPNDQAVHSTG